MNSSLISLIIIDIKATSHIYVPEKKKNKVIEEKVGVYSKIATGSGLGLTVKKGGECLPFISNHAFMGETIY